MATLIDTLLVSLKLDSGGFANDAKKATTENDKLADSIDALNETLGGVNETLKGTREQQKKAKEQSDSFTKSINNATKALAGLFTTIFMSTGLTKLIEDTARSNDQLNFLSKNLGMNATQVKRWQGAAELSGGSAEGMASSMANLNKSLWDLVTVGDTSILPYFNALNVGVVKSNGELRNLDDILLDVADSLSQMSRPQAYNFAKNMGFDEGTINMLLQGRQEMERQLALQKDIVVSSEQELEISRQLQQQNALVGMQWDGLKTLLGNYLIPYALKLSATVTGFLGYLNKNRDTAIFIFKALGTVIGVTLIPIVLKAATAFLGLFGAIGLLPALLLLLGASLWMLYDDFKKWKEGGESLLGEYWKKWDSTITPILEKLDEFKDWFKESTVGKWFTDQEGNLETWKVALGGFALWFGGKWAIGILGTLTKVGAGFFRLFGLPGLLVAGAVTAFGLLIKEISDGFDKLDELLDTVGEKTGNIAKAVIALKDPNASKEDKVNAGLEASKGIIPGADIASEIFSGRAEKVFGNLFGAGSYSASDVDVPRWDKRVFKTSKGEVVREGGSRAWRNHNEGNIEYGNYAKRHGAIGTDGRFAIFPNAETGRNAKRNLLFNSSSYKNLTLFDAIKRYAPKGENKPVQYYNAVRGAVGSDKKMGDYSAKEQEIILEAFKKVEGWKAGKEYSTNQYEGLSNTKDFFSSLSKPLIGGVSSHASDFLNQTNKLKSQPQTVNNRTDVNVGGITVNTTSSTISGVAEDATDSIVNRVYQLVPSLS